MTRTLTATITAALLASVALIPAVTVVSIVTADAAYAKSDNAGGNGKSDRSERGNKGGKSGGGETASRGNGKSGGGIEGMFRKLTGQEKKAARVAPARSNATQTVKVSKKADPMHPSNLGNMNGALNANTNAVLAHIRNGNTNGPVGLLAGLAVANANAEGAQEVIDLADDFAALQAALEANGYTSVEDYYADLDGTAGIDPITSIDEARAAFDADPTNADLEATLDLALSDAGYDSLIDYDDDRAGEAGIAEIAELAESIEGLGGDVENRGDITAEEPLPEDIETANAALEAEGSAESSILAFWNKNPDSTDEISAEEQALLDKLYERLEADSALIDEAIGAGDEAEEDVGSIEDDAECELSESCDDPLDEVVVVAE
ncbi:hypothetical protein EF888_21160 [Silicimonas algicola]|uniref:YfdX protein n=1 Tax=Silicimonas algicola TaxID=1826607 RepID=A0A316G6C5_9RHOB|nr:hypothetical protein [Silicimonas algicola]AZQ69435.1 hypothetical protein EF888_21160 [Silicimonas algicola]PWK56501.1 hypothetical protein C8D95_104173 [Silicimonas algicola]